MRKLRFESLVLLSRMERKARKIEFHRRLTVIMGENDVGKSSVIKSLYWVLGAAPAKTHPAWTDAKPKALLTFTVDNDRYRILRDNDTFGVFDAKDDVLLVTSRITKDLAPFISRLLNFQLVFSNRSGNPEIPPPAYAFLPFYIDQDGGWTGPLDSFSDLTQYTGFRKPLLEFHIGILPNLFYELDAEKKRLQIDQRELEADRRVVHKAVQQFNLEPSFDGLELSLEGHEQAIESLLGRLKQVREVRQHRARKLADVLDERTMLEQQVQVIRAAIGELEKDAKFAGDLPEEVYCPTCGTTHRNDFANRYHIVEDREACFEFLADAAQRIRIMTSQASSVETEVRNADRTVAQIQASLDEKRGDISLLQVIESRGRRIASNLFEDQIAALAAQIGELLGKISELDERLGELRKKKLRKEIETYYSKYMLNFLNKLDVKNYSADAVTKIPARILETGSDLPRALLAYFLALLRTIDHYSTSLFAPIVVDSPNQQDQDSTNVGAMIDLIVDECPLDAQIILGTVSLHGRTIKDGAVIEFTEKLSVLQPGPYEELSRVMQPYIEKLTA